MYRPGGAGPLGRALRTRSIPGRTPPSLIRPSRKPLQPSSVALTAYKPFTTSLQRYQTGNTINVKHERKVAKTPLEAHPEEVSTVSSVHQVFHEQGVEKEEEKGEDMLAGVKGDLKTIKETFALNEVPRQALNVGLAGVVPYMATSIATVYLAFDINHASDVGSGYLFSGHTAELLLHAIEPIQIGYGAVIISFLGAIHWGLEWANFGGRSDFRRYAIGIVGPAVAWPTLFFPVEYALISQFMAFTFLYFADARQVVRGLAPEWYSTYRFVLTFIVGASIVASLIGRGEIADKINKLPGPADRIKALRDSQVQYLSEEEKARQTRLASDEGDEDDEEEEDDDDE